MIHLKRFLVGFALLSLLGSLTYIIILAPEYGKLILLIGSIVLAAYGLGATVVSGMS